MKLKDLFQYLPFLLPPSFHHKDFKSLCISSKEVKPGDVFVAIKGSTIDSHIFLKDILDKGAFVVKNKDFVYESSQKEKEQIIEVPDTSAILALLSKAFFGSPDEEMTVIGITGTNGKTTVSFMVEHFLRTVAHLKTGLIGTIVNKIGEDILEDSVNTTPNGFALYSLLKKMKDAGCNIVVMEISSHALSLSRVAGLSLDIAILTNITPEHLDFHKTMKDYTEAKLELFSLLGKSPKKNKLAIFQDSIPIKKQILEEISQNPISYETYEIISSPATRVYPSVLCAQITEMNIKSTKGVLHKNHEEHPFSLPFAGEFNVHNFLCAFLCADHFQLPLSECLKSLQTFHVAGRFENIAPSYPFSIILDYAHTPDALENILKSAKNLNPSRILLLFGCGGDRDKIKRPIMGQIACKWADYVFLTSDNPRSEDPRKILSEIEKGTKENKGNPIQIIPNRKKAIEKALSIIKEGDILIIAGKGHEEYQIFKHKTIAFSDRNSVLELLKKRGDYIWN